MEKKMETTTMGLGFRVLGVLLGIMEKKMETTGILGVIGII